jgi:hypothetical protein
MTAKRMDQLSTISTVADADLLLIYDNSEAGSEKTKSITYAEFETQISGAVGGGDSGPYNSLVDGGETGALYTNGGAVELYYAGTKVLETTDINSGSYKGISIFGPSETGQTDLYQAPDPGQPDFAIENRSDTGWIYLKGTNTSSEARTFLAADPDSEVRIYHAGTNALVWKTQSKGILTGSAQNIAILSQTGYASFYNTVHGDSIRFTGEDEGGTPRILFNGDPDGAAELYYAGVKKFETTDDGVSITDGRIEGNLLVAGNLTVSGTTFTTQTETVQISDNLMVINHGEVSTGVTEGEAGIEIDRGQAVNYRFMFDETDDYFVVGISGSEQPVATRETTPTQGYVPYWDASNYQLVNTDSPIKRTTSSGVELYYAGSKVVETLATGVYIGSTQKGLIHSNGNTFAFYNIAPGENIEMHARNVGDTEYNAMLVLDPDGVAELYYAGTKKVETSNTGITVTGKTTTDTIDTTDANEWSKAQNFNEAALTSSSNSVAWNLTTAQTAVHVLTENTTIAAPSNMKAGGTYILRVVQAAGAYTLGWNAAFKWGAADTPAEPAANGDVCIFSFYSDGSSMYGVEAIREEA